jgi:hypothetical protein
MIAMYDLIKLLKIEILYSTVFLYDKIMCKTTIYNY